MRKHEFWRERATGEVWAIELHEGVVSGCFGPLEHAEVEDGLLERFEYDSERGAWVERNRERFDLYVPAAVR